MAFSLEAVFGVDTTGLRASLKSARNDLNEFVASWTKIGAGVAVTAFVALSKSALELAANLKDASGQIGINVEALQTLNFLAEQNGSSQGEMQKALEKTRIFLQQANEGGKAQIETLQKLGLNAKVLAGLPLEKKFEAIAKAYAASTDNGAAYNAVSEVFGSKIGPKMVETLGDLATRGFDAAAKSASAAGHVMSAETVVGLEKASQAIDDFKKTATVAVGNILVNFQSTEGLKLLGLQLMKAAGEFGGMILDAITEAGTMLVAVFKGSFQGVVNYFQDAMVTALQGLAKAINVILPQKFEINVGNLDQLRSSGQGIAEEITSAIAQTSPSTFKKDFGEAWGAAVDEQKKVVAAIQETDLGPEADKLRSAGDAVNSSLKDGAAAIETAGQTPKEDLKAGADAVADGGAAAAENIEDGARTVEEGGSRAGEAIARGGERAAISIGDVMGKLGGAWGAVTEIYGVRVRQDVAESDIARTPTEVLQAELIKQRNQLREIESVRTGVDSNGIPWASAANLVTGEFSYKLAVGQINGLISEIQQELNARSAVGKRSSSDGHYNGFSSSGLYGPEPSSRDTTLREFQGVADEQTETLRSIVKRLRRLVGDPL